MKKIKLNSAIGLLMLGFISQAHATKTCGTAKCSVPDNADCSTYSEHIVTDPLVGTPVSHTGVVITAPTQGSCDSECEPFSFSYQTTETKTIGGSITAGLSTTDSVKASVVAAEATASLTASISATGTVTGSSSSSTTITAGPIKLCKGQGIAWTVIGDYKTGDFSSAARVKGYYYPTSPSDSPLLSVSCQEATGTANGSRQYYNVSGHLGARYSISCP